MKKGSISAASSFAKRTQASRASFMSSFTCSWQVLDRVGRLISDGKASKPGQSTNRDLPHTVRQKRMPECDLLVVTGGT